MPTGGVSFTANSSSNRSCLTSAVTPPTSSMSICLWMNPLRSGGDSTFSTAINITGTASLFTPGLQIIASGNQIQLWKAAATLATSIAAPSQSGWYFVGLTLSGTNAKLYAKPLGGRQCVVAATTFTTFTPHEFDFGDDFNGDNAGVVVSNVKVWAGVNVLTAAEIDMESRQLTPVRRGDLFEWWTMSSTSDLIGRRRRTVLSINNTTGLDVNSTVGPAVPLDLNRLLFNVAAGLISPSAVVVNNAIFFDAV